MQVRITPLAWLLSCSLLVASFGCHTLKTDWSMPWEKETEPVLPDRILAVWSDTVLHQPGQPGVRGFGGRLFFYEDESTEPVPVDGALMIYVFDAETYDPARPEPLKRYAYTADQFADLHSRAPLGESYSVWVPWDEVGGASRSLSLVVKFEGRDGGTVISDPVVKLLPGLPREVIARREAALQDEVRQVGYDDSGSEAWPGMRTSNEISTPRVPIGGRGVETIDLPPSFSRHLQNSEERGVAPMMSPTPTSNGSVPAFQPPSRTLERTGSLDSPAADSGAALQDEATRFAPRARAGSMGSSPYRTYPTRTPGSDAAAPRTIRDQPFPGGWVDDLPQTPRVR
ncbi:MAG: hypothetical protein KDA83_10260 [Planctomycetales bacterium]|nr:hypothetical protein [Planctomycetales bacterium]